MKKEVQVGGIKPVNCVFCEDIGKVDVSRYAEGKLLWKGERPCHFCQKRRLFWRPSIAGALGIIPLLFVLVGFFTALINAKSTPLNLLGLVLALAAIYFFICLILRFTVDEEPAKEPETVKTDLEQVLEKKAKKVPARKRRG